MIFCNVRSEFIDSENVVLLCFSYTLQYVEMALLDAPAIISSLSDG